MPCSGLFGYIVPTAEQFVRYVCSVHFGRSPVCSGTLSTSDLDRLVSSCLFVTFVRNMLALRLSVPEFCSRVCSDCLDCSFSVFVSLHALFVSVREYCSDIRVVCSLRCSIQFSLFSRFVLRSCSRHAFSPCPSGWFVR